MRPARWLALTGSLGLAASVVAAAPSIASARPAPHATGLTALAAKELSHPDGSVAAGSPVDFDLVLSLRNATGAQTFTRQVSTPGSALFHHYLTDAQWESRFGPTASSVSKAEAWLRSHGFSAGAVPSDRMYVPATGTAAQVEKAFGVKLGWYKVNGQRVRMAKTKITVPSGLSGSVSGAFGINQFVATTGLAAGGTQVSSTKVAAPATTSTKTEPPPAAGFRNARVCGKYWGQKADTKDKASLYKPFVYPESYDICGYTPAQLRSAYGLTGAIAKGDTGKGQTIAIVDAYDSPTLLADTQNYFKRNDPSHPLKSSQFTNDAPSHIGDLSVCAGGNGWYAEQALDVETTHAIAPGANLIYEGGPNCENGLFVAENNAITSGATIVSNSWLDALGDVFDDPAFHTAFDNVFLLADGTGVSVLFCTGDNGDNFATFGLTIPDYPATSPYVTAVGGTTLEIGADGQRTAEYGWSTARQVMCEVKATNCGSASKPASSLLYDDGAGGGTSYFYGEPYYQDGIVPSALADRNEAVTGISDRVTPDVAMDADPQSGYLIGLTQAFPNGTYYDQFKEGGTSLATPLMAGVVALTNQKAGAPLGFLNPELYKADAVTPAAFNDILPPANPDAAGVVRVDYANGDNPQDGYIMSLRAIDYEGAETFCDPTGNCETRNVTTTTAKGYDSLTGLGSVGASFLTDLSKY